jgi:DNA-binding transcriptional regulator PaaX
MNSTKHLDKLLKVVDDLFDFLETLSDTQVRQTYYLYHGFSGKIPRTTYYHKIDRFLKYGLIKKVRKNNRIAFQVTSRAKALRANPSIKNYRTDGLSTLIMFDIPESKRTIRKEFRRYLLKNGYTQIQKSVFLSPFEVSNDLILFVKELEIEKNVTFMSGKVDYLVQ